MVETVAIIRRVENSDDILEGRLDTGLSKLLQCSTSNIGVEVLVGLNSDEEFDCKRWTSLE